VFLPLEVLDLLCFKRGKLRKRALEKSVSELEEALAEMVAS
jgi:hypothetical protein